MADKEEFRNAVRDIAQCAPKLDSPYERVRVAEWVRRLCSLPDTPEGACIRHQYSHLLRIMVRGRQLRWPFSRPPPSGEIPPLIESLGREVVKRYPQLPAVGPIAPIMTHKSPDGSAYVAARQIPGRGLFCYLAVNTEDLECYNQEKI